MLFSYNDNIKNILNSLNINIWKSYIESTKKDNIFLIFFPYLEILENHTQGYRYNLPKITNEQRNILFNQLKELYNEDIKLYLLQRYQSNNSEEFKNIVNKLFPQLL